MVNTKEDCFIGVDRSVLLELKKIYVDLKTRTDNLGPTEKNVLDRLENVFTELIKRPFLQGDSAATLMNMQDQKTFIEAVGEVINYLKLIGKSQDIDSKNLSFRLSKILEGEQPVKQVGENWNSDSLRKFIAMFENKDGISVEAFSSGIPRTNQSISGSYVTFKGNSNENGTISTLMSMAVNNDIGIEIINSNGGFTFSLLINPYEVDEKVERMLTLLEQYQNKSVDPAVRAVLEYVKRISQDMKDSFRVSFCKFEDGQILFEEESRKYGIKGGYLPEKEFIDFYNNKSFSEVSKFPNVNASDIARSALDLFNSIPGELAESMRKVLSTVRGIFNKTPVMLEK